MSKAILVDLLDEVAEHLLGHLEVGDHPVLQGPDSLDGAGGASEHTLGLDADGVHLSGAWSIATTLGSDSTMPRPRTYTSVFAVPRSTAMSRPPNPVR